MTHKSKNLNLTRGVMLPDRPSRLKTDFLANYTIVTVLLAGAMIRWIMAYVVYPADEHIFSDIKGYVTVAERILDPAHRFNPFDMVQGIGTPLVLALSLKAVNSLQLAKLLWWVFSSLTPILWTAAANLIPVSNLKKSDKKVFVVLVAVLTSFDVSHIASSNLFMPESPFTFLIAGGFAALFYSMATSKKGHMSLAILAGLSWSTATLFRGHGVIILFACLALGITDLVVPRLPNNQPKNRDSRYEWRNTKKALILATASMILGLAVNGSFFRLMTGRFAISALNGPTNILMGHLLDAKEVRFEVRELKMFHAYGNPAVHQRMPEATYVFPFSVIDSKSAIAAIKILFLKDPIQYVYLSFKNAWQTFAGNYPWPAIFMPTSRWLQLYESIFLLFALLPALATLLMQLSNWRDYSSQSWAVFFLGLQIVGLWFISFMVIGETRYRVPFDGVILILASLTWTRWFLKKDVDQRLKIARSATS